MKPYYYSFILILMCGYLIHSAATSAQPAAASPANNVQDDNRTSDKPFAEALMASQNFIENINGCRKNLSMKQFDLAKSKIIMARILIPIITKAKPTQRRLTRVEFGGGLYADDLNQRMNYNPIETQSLENFTRATGSRWVKNTRAESDAQIIYITLDMTHEKAKKYLDQAEKHIESGNIREAQMQLDELSDRVIKVGYDIPAAVQVRDYIILANNYTSVGNFFGARSSLQRVNGFLDQMRNEETYKNYYPDIVILHQNISDLQEAFAEMDANQIKDAGINLKKWQTQVSAWTSE